MTDIQVTDIYTWWISCLVGNGCCDCSVVAIAFKISQLAEIVQTLAQLKLTSIPQNDYAFSGVCTRY